MRFKPWCAVVLALFVVPPLVPAGERETSAEAKMKLGRINVQLPTAGVEFDAIAAIYQVELERDTATGLPTGKRQHRPITIAKTVDKATPMLLEALTSGSKFDEVKIKILPSSHSRRSFFEYTLDGVQFVGYQSTSETGDRPTEEITLVFNKIRIYYPEQDTTHEDDWQVEDER